MHIRKEQKVVSKSKEILKKGEYKCECGKDFHSKHHLIGHQDICRIVNTIYVCDLRAQVKKLNEQVLILNGQLEDSLKREKEIRTDYTTLTTILANQSSTTHNTVNNLNSHYFQDQAIIEIEPEIVSTELNEESYELTPLDLGKGFVIEHREEDGYINVTNLCRAGGKQFKAWNRLARTKAFVSALSSAVTISTTDLIKLGTGSNYDCSGTWVHPQVAINIAQWISPQFDVKVSAWIYEVMMTGKVDITNTKSYRQLQSENKDHKIKIKHLTNKYMKKQPRLEIKERNVIYILTTRLLKKERRYILGKATNLTNRLSTYNKSDEHEIVYYIECGDENKMSLVEPLIFSKLNVYREQANRERFILPEDKEISLFVDIINQCVEFV